MQGGLNMPVEKKFKTLISRIYKQNAENLMLFTWVKAQQSLFPAMELKQVLLSFRRFTGITIDEWDDESMRSTYTRIQKEYFDDCKS